MRSSGISSAKATLPPHDGPPAERFALTGRSVALDPTTNAVRKDIADIRLAEQVFAPHYAVPMERVLIADTALCGDAACEAKVAMLKAGEVFEVLELSGDKAWGVAQRLGLVGYIAAAALDRVDPQG